MNNTYKTAIALIAMAAGATSSASAAVSITAGLNNNGGLRIINASTSAETIVSVRLYFVDSDTFFDTDSAAPGVSPQGFSSTINVGTPTLLLPSDAATDGTDTATFFYVGTTSTSDDISFGFDLDLLSSPDGDGDASSGRLEVTMLVDGVTETLNLTPQGSGDVGGQAFNQVFSAVPEPSSLALLGLGGVALIFRRRKG